MKEQIIKILKQWYEVFKMTEEQYNDLSDEIENLFRQTYINECIAKAEPNLSKIQDVDKELAEIREADKSCIYCEYRYNSSDQCPCDECENYLKWEPKTE